MSHETTINIECGMFVVQPLTHEISHRSLEIEWNNGIENDLDRATNGGSRVNTSSLNSIAPKIIAPSSVSNGARIIEGGWQNQHISGNMIIMENTPSEQRMVMLTVYTDRVELSTNDIDPDTLFIIDSRKTLWSTVNGEVGSNAFLNIQPVDTIDHDHHLSTKDDLTRPSDAMFKMQQVALEGRWDDWRCKSSVTGEATSIQDSNPAHYIAKAANNLTIAKKNNEADNLGFADDTTIFDDAGSLMENASNDTSVTMDMLSKRTQFGETGKFTWKELCELLNRQGRRVTDVCEVIGAVTGPMEDNRNNSDGWHGSDKVTNLAFRINDRLAKEVNARPLMYVDLSITQAPNGAPVVAATNYAGIFKSVPDYLVSQAVNEIEQIMRIELMSIVNTYAMCYNITAHITGFSMNRYDIHLDDDPRPTTKYVPAFCNSLGSTMVADSESSTIEFATDLRNVMNALVDLKEPGVQGNTFHHAQDQGTWGNGRVHTGRVTNGIPNRERSVNLDFNL